MNCRNLVQITNALLVASAVSTANAAVISSGSGQYVWTDLVGLQSTCQPGSCPLSGIAGSAGERIHILRLGIGGDADFQSGDTSFRLSGGGLDFTWTAGQQAVSATYDLGATPVLSGSARGFTYSAPLSLLAADGASLQLFWSYRFDYDGRYTNASDLLGNPFNDSAFASSIRPWVLFERVATRRMVTSVLVSRYTTT